MVTASIMRLAARDRNRSLLAMTTFAYVTKEEKVKSFLLMNDTRLGCVITQQRIFSVAGNQMNIADIRGYKSER